MQLKSIPVIGKCVSLSLGILIFMSSCSSDGKRDGQSNRLDSLAVNDIFKDIGETKRIFYSLPSPLETAMLIKTAGAKYNEDLLNPVSNSSKYTTNRSKALNLGIYTTDLSFASLFDQTQACINYMNAAKIMADGLGILDAIDNNTIERLEENINNRDVIMDIISETFLSSSSYLKENDREPVATVVLAGGWIEGLYLGTQIASANLAENKKLIERIAEQKLSFEILQRLLNEHKENGDVAELMNDIQSLVPIFNKITINTSGGEKVTDKETNIATIKGESEIVISNETFKELTLAIQNLRNKFII